jgi:hypothetical protein
MSGLAVIPYPMEQVARIRTNEEEITFDKRWQTGPDPVDQTVEFLQLKLKLYSAVLSSFPIALQYPIQIVSPTEIDVDRDAMTIGEPYHFKLGDVYLVAVKQDDGTVDFYTFG